MKKVKITIWGREFNLPVEFDIRDDEEVSPNQIEAVNKLIASKEDIKSSIYEVVDYCSKKNPREFKYDNKGNIFKYVMPKYLFVPNDKHNHIVAIMCNYKFDSDNGIAVVFKNEKFSSIGNQDSIL